MKFFPLFIIPFLMLFLQTCKTSKMEIENPENIILIISNGINVQQFQKAYNDKGDLFHLSRADISGICKINSIDKKQLEQGANATILSIGHKSLGRYIGLDSNGYAQPNLMEIASIKGKATGILTANTAVDASAAAFVAHTNNKSNLKQIAMDYLSSPLDVFIGGGRAYFNQSYHGENLLEKLSNKGYVYCDNIENAKPDSNIFILLDKKMSDSFKNQDNNWGEAVKLALSSLSLSKKGFFLLVDISLINENDGIDEFNQAVKLAFDYVDKQPSTKVIVAVGPSANNIVKANKDLDMNTEALISTYAYGKNAGIFAGNYELTEIHNKIAQSFERVKY